MKTSPAGDVYGATPWWKQALVWSLATGIIALAVGFTLGKAFSPVPEAQAELSSPPRGLPTLVFADSPDGQNVLPTRPNDTSRVRLSEPEVAPPVAVE
jgi:hypothetical protein